MVAAPWFLGSHVSDRFQSTPSGISRNALIAGGVVLFHVAALWALQNGLLRRAAEVVIPVEVLAQFIEPAKPVEPPPPPPPPPPAPKVKAPPPPKPMAIREPRPAPNAPTGTVEPPPPAPPAPVPPPPAPPAPAPAPPAPKLVEVGENEVRYTRSPQPVFPSMSKRLGESGTVIIAVYFNAAGVPKKADVFKSSGYDRLDQAARDAVMNSRVTPIQRPGADESTVFMFRAPISFALTN